MRPLPEALPISGTLPGIYRVLLKKKKNMGWLQLSEEFGSLFEDIRFWLNDVSEIDWAGAKIQSVSAVCDPVNFGCVIELRV